MSSNFFDQFDESTARPVGKGGNFFDQFDPTGAKPVPKTNLLDDVKDSAIALGTGVTQGIGMLANVAGADNAVSRTMADATQALSEYESPHRKAEKQERARKIKEAEESGSTWEEVKAYAGSFADAPLDTTLNALGTIAPTALATVATGGLGAAGTGARIAAQVAPKVIGAAQGVGTVKGSIYEDVQRRQLEAGATPEQAEAAAAKAQAYDGENLDNIALGAALGGVASSVGVEGALGRLAAGKLTASGADGALKTLAKGAGTGVLKETPVEMLQGGQERYATNVAAQREGFDVPTWQGVAGQAALEGLASAPLGGGMGAVEAMAGRQTAKPKAEPQPTPEVDAEKPVSPLMIGNAPPDRLYVFPDGTVGRTGEVENYITSLPEDQQADARAKFMGQSIAEVNNPQARRWWENYSSGDPAQAPDYLAEVQQAVRSGTPFTTQQTVETVRNAMEDAWLAQNVGAAEESVAPALAADEMGAQLQGAFDESGEESALAAVDARVRTSRILTGLQNLLDEGTDGAVQVLGRLNENLTRINEAPLAQDEQNRVLRMLDARAAFTGKTTPAPLPSYPESVSDPFADNSSLEAVIPERRRPDPVRQMLQQAADAGGALSSAALKAMDTGAVQASTPTPQAQHAAVGATQPQTTPNTQPNHGWEKTPLPQVGQAQAAIENVAKNHQTKEGAPNGPQATQAQQDRTQPSQAGAAAQFPPGATAAQGSAGSAVDQPAAGLTSDFSQDVGAGPSAAQGAAQALRQRLQDIEAKILQAAPDAVGQGGGDIEAAMKSRKVPVTLKVQRTKLREQIRAADEVQTFAPETGTLDIPRQEMPQVPTQAAVLADMGIGENADGEIDATEPQWTEIERRIAERLGRKPAEDATQQPAPIAPANVQEGIAQARAKRKPKTPEALASQAQAQQLGMDALPVELGAPVAQALPGAAAQESRPRNWRTSMLGAVPVAKALGIEHKGKRLAQVVAEIDARDSDRNQLLGQEQQAQAAIEYVAPKDSTRTDTGAADVKDDTASLNPERSQSVSPAATAAQPVTRTDVTAAQQQGAQPTAREAQELGAKQREEAKKQKQRTARQDSATETGLRVGVAPGNAETVTVRDGVVYLGAYEALNYDTGEPITVAKGSTREQVAQALKEAGVLSSRQRLFGLGERSAEVMFSRKQMDGAQDGKPSNPEAQRQFKETERAYGGRAAYDRAKAAGKTKLTYGQWVQVRTPNFKAWFGDWEVQSSNSVVNQQIEQWASGELPANVILNIGHPSSVLTQHGVPNMPITLRQAILRKAVKDKHGVAAAQLKDIAQAVQAPTAIFDDPDNPGTRIAVTEIRHTDGNIIAAIRLNTERDGLEINDIRSIHPKRDSSVLRWVEDGLLLGLDKEKGRDWLENLAATNPQQPQADFAALDSILYDAVTVRNASKVVDAETGEPLVVYHGTASDFSEFQKKQATDKEGRRLSMGWGSQKFYFATYPGAASSAAEWAAVSKDRPGNAANVMPVYLRIENPISGAEYASQLSAVVGEGMGRDAAIKALDKRLMAEGYDGIVDEDSGGIAVFDGKQVKSATGNNGNFDPANPDIRFSFAGQQAATADSFDFEAMRAAVLGSGEGLMSPEQARAILALRRPARATKESVHAALRQLVGGLGLLPNRLGRVVVATAAEIKQDWEPLIGPTGMEASDAGEAQGFYDPKSRTVFLIADHITAGDELGVVAHELMHKHGQAVLGEEGWNKLHGAIEGWARAQPGSMERRVYEEAMERVQASRPDGVNAARYSSQELFPYAVQVALEMGVQPNLLAKPGTVARWLGQVRAALRQVWDKITRKPEQFKTQDLVNLAFGIAQRENPEHAGELDGMIGQRGVDTGESPMFSRAAPTPKQGAAGWAAPSASQWDDMVYKLQDKHIDLKRVVESITKSVGAVADNVNAYLKEELFHKRAAKRVADFGAKELKPLMNQMRIAGLSMEDVEEYLHARHAKEANALLAERNPSQAMINTGRARAAQDVSALAQKLDATTDAAQRSILQKALRNATKELNRWNTVVPYTGTEESRLALSGMSDKDADNYFAKLDPTQRKKLDGVAKSVDAIIENTRKLYVSYGLEDQEVVDSWRNAYKHYIPLMREDKDGGMGTGQGFSVRGKEVKGRTGSTRKVVDILANIATQREKLIVRGEKNIVTQALVGLAQANPNPDFWEVRSQVPTERVIDEATNTVVERPIPGFKSQDNVIIAKTQDANGKVTEQMVVFNEDNPRAVRMAAALKNLDAGNLEGLLGVSAKITRYFAAINTQYNPVFGVVNLVRDVQGALINLAETPLAGQQMKIAKDTLSALKGIYSDIRQTRKGGQADSKWAQLWEQMQDDGGTTGYRDLFKTSADRADNLKSILNPESWMDSKWGKVFTADGKLKVPLGMAQKGASEIFGWLSDYNEAMENGVRLAAYKAALDKGMSREQAASLAKNLTVNFNRKGQVGMQAGAVYAFFNAAMQGTARIGKTLFTLDNGDIKTLRLSKTGKAVVYGGVMLGAIQALALAGAGFDEEDPPEFVRERSLIIPTGGKTYISIPMPLGLHVIPGIGRHAVEFALSGGKDPAKRIVSMTAMFADAFNPIGNAGMSLQTIAPTALDPLVALAENKDYTGKSIARTSFNPAVPGHTQWKDTATGLSKMIAEAINWVSGGNEYVAGAFSPTPDQIDYLIAQLGGGVARELAKVQQTISTAVSGEELPTYKVPLVGRFYGNASGQASQGTAFYANLDKLNALDTELKGLRKDGRYAEAAELARKHPESIMIAMANKAQRDVQALRREKRELIAQGADRATVRAKEQQITAVMQRLNDQAERRKTAAG